MEALHTLDTFFVCFGSALLERVFSILDIFSVQSMHILHTAVICEMKRYKPAKFMDSLHSVRKKECDGMIFIEMKGQRNCCAAFFSISSAQRT